MSALRILLFLCSIAACASPRAGEMGSSVDAPVAPGPGVGGSTGTGAGAGGTGGVPVDASAGSTGRDGPSGGCPPGQRNCGGRCIAESSCCSGGVEGCPAPACVSGAAVGYRCESGTCVQDRQECGAPSCAGDTATIRSCMDGMCRSEPRGCEGLGCAGTTCVPRCPAGSSFMGNQCVACGGTGQPCCDGHCPGGTCTGGRCCPPGQLWTGDMCMPCPTNFSVCNAQPPVCRASSWGFEVGGAEGFEVNESSARVGQPVVTGIQRFQGNRSLAVPITYEGDFGEVVVGVRPCGAGITASLRGTSVSVRYKIVADGGGQLPTGDTRVHFWVNTAPGTREEAQARIDGAAEWQQLVVMFSPANARTVGQIALLIRFGTNEPWKGTLYLDNILVE